MELTANNKTRTYFRSIKSVSASNIIQMYDLYAQYYENTSLEIFLKDLSKKSGVLMVERKSDGCVVGFSTQVIMDLTVDNKRVRGIFSGDTIIDKRYWGNNDLSNAFYKLVVRNIIFRAPWVPLYWFLISKGYKTYLLMTNNSYKFYPRVGGNPGDKDEHYQHITESYCEQLFPDAFDKEKKILNFGNDYVHLKGDVADITPELVASNENIAFFDKVNPGWRQGNELPCLAALDYHSILISMWARPAKWFKRNVLRQKVKGLQVSKQIDANRQQQDTTWVAGDTSEIIGASKAS